MPIMPPPPQVSSSLPNNENPKSFPLLKFILIALILSILAGVGFSLYSSSKHDVGHTDVSEDVSAGRDSLPSISEIDEEDAVLSHVSESMSFSLDYPANFTVREMNDTITINDSNGSPFLTIVKDTSTQVPNANAWYEANAADDFEKSNGTRISGMRSIKFTTSSAAIGCGYSNVIVKHGTSYIFEKLPGTCDVSDEVVDTILGSVEFGSSDEVLLNKCERPSGFVDEGWYENLQNEALNIDISLGLSSEMCANAEGTAVVFVIPNATNTPPQLYKYEVNTRALEKARVVSHNQERFTILSEMPMLRENNTSFIVDKQPDQDGCLVRMIYGYDYFFNVLELEYETIECIGDGESDPRKSSSRIEYVD